MQDDIAWEEKQWLAKVCNENWFSQIIDECADTSVSEVLAVMVRFYNVQRLQTHYWILLN